MTSQQPVMRLMRLMARINIGALLGMAAWLPWSGWQVATGQVAATPPEPTVRAALPSVGVEPAPMRLVPVSVAVRAAGHCPLPAATAGFAPVDRFPEPTCDRARRRVRWFVARTWA